MEIYPEEYICEKCGHAEEFSKEEHMELREMLSENEELKTTKKDLPLFFECHMCHEGIMKPRNYSGSEGFIVPNLDF